MQASKEFLAELKVLTHVHHLNLVISHKFYFNLTKSLFLYIFPDCGREITMNLYILL